MTLSKRALASSVAAQPSDVSERTAFETAFRTHAAELCEFAFGYVRSRETASELVQDVFFRLWKRRDTINELEDLRVYLFAATRNAVLDLLKHERVERRWVERLAPVDVAATTSQAHDTDERVRARDVEAALEAAVARLPERARQTFVLSWRHHLSCAQVATIMGISVKAVEVQRSRARKALRRALAHWLE